MSEGRTPLENPVGQEPKPPFPEQEQEPPGLESEMEPAPDYGADAVAPGPVWTPLIPATIPGEHVAKFGEQSPMGRPAQPAELAPVYVLLASDESRYIVGEVVGVTGGTPVG